MYKEFICKNTLVNAVISFLCSILTLCFLNIIAYVFYTRTGVYGMRNPTLYGILAIVLLVASITAAYAMWSETLKVNVEVSTGEVDVRWDTATKNDLGIDPGYDKDIADCELDTISENELADKVNITITNGYPSYNCTITVRAYNIGTIPVKLLNTNLTLPGGEEEILYSAPQGIDKLREDINLTYLDLVVKRDIDQIDPDDYATYTISIHIKQPAEENSQYSLEISFAFAQWNEIP